MPWRPILRILTAAALLIPLSLAACGGQGSGTITEASDSATATATASPASPSTTPLEAADGTDLGACFDGECEVLITGPVDIELDPELGVQASIFSVTQFDEDVLGIEWSGGTSQSMSSGAIAWVMTGGYAHAEHTTPQGLSIKVDGFDGEQMVLTLSIDS